METGAYQLAFLTGSGWDSIGFSDFEWTDVASMASSLRTMDD